MKPLFLSTTKEEQNKVGVATSFAKIAQYDQRFHLSETFDLLNPFEYQ